MALIDIEAAAARRIGFWAAIAVAGVVLIYAAVLAVGLAALVSPADPIADPWFTAMEGLILLLAPLLIVLWAAIHVQAPPMAKAFTLAGLMFASLTAALTGVLHALILTLARGAGQAPDDLSFRWPSAAYAVDILAWDVFFGLAALLAAPAFGRAGLDGVIRILLVTSGLLSLAGVLGPVTGHMDLRLIGVFGYTVVFSLAAGLMAIRFRRAPTELPSDPASIR